MLLADRAQASGSRLALSEYSLGAHLKKPPRILTRLGEGAGELIVYFDPVISVQEKILFSGYLFGVGTTFVRIACPPVGNLEVAMKRLQEGKTDIGCLNCDDPGKRVPLWDELQQRFASRSNHQPRRGKMR
jgi:hypothetical protein